jgi:hypothetical protein
MFVDWVRLVASSAPPRPTPPKEITMASTLQRFNQVLLAVLGIASLGLLLLLVITMALDGCGGSRQWGQIPTDENADPSPERLRQALVPCLPTTVRGSSTRFIGVAILDTVAPRIGAIPSSGSKWAFSPECTLKDTRGGKIQNVLVWPREGEQRLLFDGRLLVHSLTAPGEDCEESSSLATCNTLLWQVRDRDTNGDHVIGFDDALAAYVSDLDGSKLRRVTPEASHLISIVRDPDLGYLFQAHRDEDGNGKFEPHEAVELFRFDPEVDERAQAVVSEVAAEALRGLLP